MDDELNGDYILELLRSLAPEAPSQNILHLYEMAYAERQNHPHQAIERCRKALAILEKSAQIPLGNSDALVYAKGLCYLLIASIYLNEETLERAKYYYLQSRNEFHLKQWSHLESLAYLGLAITWRKMENFREASDACADAQYYIDHESISGRINKTDLRAAITQAREAIDDLSLPPSPPQDKLEEKPLPIFGISLGERFVSRGGTTDLNLLTKADYLRYTGNNPPVGVLDLEMWPQARTADYILEIDDQVTRVDNDLGQDIWLLVREESDPQRLKGKTVAVLVTDEGGVYASQKVFARAEDHYFLKAISEGGQSIVIWHYRTDNFSRIEEYYKEFGEIEKKLAYNVRVSGEVVEMIKVIKPVPELRKTFVWRVPIVEHLPAAAGQPIAPDNIRDYIHLGESEARDANYFIFVVDEDGMTGDNIFPGNNALIRQQANVNRGEIAAVVINTPTEEEIALRRYFFDDTAGRLHWFLQVNNPAAKHLVVVPEVTDIGQIRRFYARLIATDRVMIYENAELTIAGQFIRVVE
jgi:SOS-response transcriptional repressor LexA